MYIGHAALALLAKAKRPALAMALVVPVAWAPDLVEYILLRLGSFDRMLSHSIVAVALGATIVSLVYYAGSRVAADAGVLWLAYASHWPADYITGRKPTWPHGPVVGLLLYNHVIADFVLECGLISFACVMYWRSLPNTPRKRRYFILLPLSLIGLQLVFEFFNGRVDYAGRVDFS